MEIDFVSFLQQYKTLIIILHALAAAVGLGSATVTDIFFFKFLKDNKITEDESSLMKTLSGIIWVALAIMFLTGVGLFFSDVVKYSHSAKFLIKMTAFFVLVLNGVFLNFVVSPKMVKIDFTGRTDEAENSTKVLRKISFVLGAISITNWYLIFSLGLLKSIPISYKLAFTLYISFIALVILASQFLEYKMRKNFKNN